MCEDSATERRVHINDWNLSTFFGCRGFDQVVSDQTVLLKGELVNVSTIGKRNNVIPYSIVVAASFSN